MCVKHGLLSCDCAAEERAAYIGNKHGVCDCFGSPEEQGHVSGWHVSHPRFQPCSLLARLFLSVFVFLYLSSAGELNWVFTAITDTIAWNVLPRALFQKLFRQVGCAHAVPVPVHWCAWRCLYMETQGQLAAGGELKAAPVLLRSVDEPPCSPHCNQAPIPACFLHAPFPPWLPHRTSWSPRCSAISCWLTESCERQTATLSATRVCRPRTSIQCGRPGTWLRRCACCSCPTC